MIGATLALLLAAAAPAAAQPQPEPDPNDQRARNHFASGNSYYQTGDYENAIREFNMSYELSRRPQLLFNLANAYERNGQLAESIDHLQRYLEATPEEPNRATLEARIENMRRRLAAADTGGGPPGGDGGEGGGDGGEGGGDGGDTTAPIDGGGGAPGLAIAGFGVAGAGLVSGLVFGLLAGNEYHRLEESGECGATRECSDDDVGTLGTYSLVADLSFGLSLVGAIVGTIGLLTWDAGDEAPPVGAWLGPGSGGVTARGTF